MILVDTSVWIAHLRAPNDKLLVHMAARQVCSHDFVLGELAIGSLHPRAVMIEYISNLPRLATVEARDVLHMIEARRLHGSGIGYVDAHLLSSLLLSKGSRLMTGDKRMAAAAQSCDIEIVPA